MARIELAPEVVDDLDRFLDHMAQFDAVDAAKRIEEIVEASRLCRVVSLSRRGRYGFHIGSSRAARVWFQALISVLSQ
jgi:plasmid stabilization system protein ParE